jgi:hypothetical protein
MTEENTQMQIGDKMADGSIYAGMSPETYKPMYVMPEDAFLAIDFNQAAKYAEKLNAQNALSHNDWRVPTKEELNLLYKNKNKGSLKGTFNETGSPSDGWYWSATDATFRGTGALASSQRFKDGFDYGMSMDQKASVRCVR